MSPATLMSALQEKTEVNVVPPTAALGAACAAASALAEEAGAVQQECGLDVLPDEYARATLRFGLVEASADQSSLP